MSTTPVYHIPVLVDEVLTYLDPQPGKLYLDATFGGGGHTRAILQREPKCRVLAVDWDLNALQQNEPVLSAEFGERLQCALGNFANLGPVLKRLNITSVDGILADFGTSQHQIKNSAGFSVYQDLPLDMRMSAGFHKLTAAVILNTYDVGRLARLFQVYGEEHQAYKIARAIVAARNRSKLRTTGELAKLIEQVVPVPAHHKRLHPATKVFQALRIYVNQELENIAALLKFAPQVLNQDARLVCISFHSLEDRLVKQALRADQRFEILTPKVVVGTAAEIRANPSARSAKLRAARFHKS